MLGKRISGGPEIKIRPPDPPLRARLRRAGVPPPHKYFSGGNPGYPAKCVVPCEPSRHITSRPILVIHTQFFL